jgi:hypothetical protein
VVRIATKNTAVLAYQFLTKAGPGLWLSLLLPVLTGGILLYGSMNLYLLDLERYLIQPTDRIGSVILGLAATGFLTVTFVQAVISSEIASRFLDRPDGGWRFFRITRRVWRLYAAYLRFLLLCAVYIVAVQIVRLVAGEFLVLPLLPLLDALALAAGLFYLTARIGLLVTSVAVATDKGPVVRGAWRISAGNFRGLALVVGGILILGLALETVGEILLHAAGLGVVTSPGMLLVDVVRTFRTALPGVIIVVSLSYLATNILGNVAGLSVYRQMTAPTAPDEQKPEV